MAKTRRKNYTQSIRRCQNIVFLSVGKDRYGGKMVAQKNNFAALSIGLLSISHAGVDFSCNWLRKNRCYLIC